MKEFKIGDRVKMIGFGCTGEIVENQKGLIVGMGSATLQISIDGPETSLVRVWPSQCKRLVKTKLREWWLNIYPVGDPVLHLTRHGADENAQSARVDCILVREVKKFRTSG